MKFSTTQKSIQLYAETYNLNIDFQQFEQDLKTHKEYPASLAYVECLQKQDIHLTGLKLSENNIDFLPFPMLCVLQDYHHGSIFSYLDRSEEVYTYYKDNQAYTITLRDLEKLWLGPVFFEKGFLENQEIYIEENLIENNVVLDFRTSYGSIVGIRNSFKNHSAVSNFFVDIIGNDNQIVFYEGSELNINEIRIRGNKNRLVIGKNCRIKGDFVLEGGNTCITVGDNTTVEDASFSATESKSLSIGSDCMFSFQVSVKTSDSHSIIDLETGERINPAKDVVIEDHVWLAPNVSVLKGVTIGQGTVIGIGSVVVKSIPRHTLAVGSPAKPIRSSISWDRELK